MTFKISIYTGTDEENRLVESREVFSDWKRADMAAALDLIMSAPGGANSICNLQVRAGNATCKGEIQFWVWASPKWIAKLADLLEGAEWDYKTKGGYGIFIEKLISHKADWQLAQAAKAA